MIGKSSNIANTAPCRPLLFGGWVIKRRKILIGVGRWRVTSGIWFLEGFTHAVIRFRAYDSFGYPNHCTEKKIVAMIKQITTVTIFKLKSLSSNFWAFQQVPLAIFRLKQVPGLTFFKSMGSGEERDLISCQVSAPTLGCSFGSLKSMPMTSMHRIRIF